MVGGGGRGVRWLVGVGRVGVGGWVGDGVDGGMEWGGGGWWGGCVERDLTNECTRWHRRSTSSSVEISCKK